MRQADARHPVLPPRLASSAESTSSEGRQIVFVYPELVPGLDLTGATRASYEDVLAAASRLTR